MTPKTALRAALESPTAVLDVDLRATSYVLHGDAGSRDVRIVVVGDVGRAAAGKATAVAALYDLEGRPANAMESVVDVPASRVGAGVDRRARAARPLRRCASPCATPRGTSAASSAPIDARWKRPGGVETPGLVLLRSAPARARRRGWCSGR